MYIVDKIIDKCEGSKNDWQQGAAGNRSFRVTQADYNACGKSEFVDEAEKLEAKGVIFVKWLIRGSDVEVVRFRLEDLGKFYDMSQRTPKWKIVEAMKEIIGGELANISKEWIRRYYGYLLGRLFPRERENEIISQNPDFYLPAFRKMGRREEYERFAAKPCVKTEKRHRVKIGKEDPEPYFPVFRGLDKLEAPVYKRIFSSRYTDSSKRFENEQEQYVLCAARKFCDEVAPTMSDTEALSQIYIEEYSQELAVKGPLRIRIKKDQKYAELDLKAYFYGTVLNTQTLKNMEILSGQPDIKRVITIENKANFVLAPFDENTLYIFTHGYFSPMERCLLRRLEDVLQGNEVEFLHSGDLDYGGVKIFEYIQKNVFKELKPFRMDVKTYEKYLSFGEKIEEQTLEKLRNTDIPQLQGLIDKILEKKLSIEQESFLTGAK